MSSSGDLGVPDKMTVFQKSVGSFNRTGISAEEARSSLTQLVHLFYVGETFQEAEATQSFFTITRLFQKDSPGLKQMIYLAIKESVPLTDNVIMGTSVLMRDVQQAQSSPQAFSYRPEASRALCRISDAGAVEGMDRLMRSAIVDRDENMSSAALVSAYHLSAIARDSVRRWATEIQEAYMSQKNVSQYHALGSLIEVRSHDTIASSKLAVSLAEQGSSQCPNAMASHIRLIGSLLAEQPRNTASSQISKNYCFNRSDIVASESAKTILEFANPRSKSPAVLSQNDEIVSSAIGVLRAYLESPRATSRFAAIRALSRFAEVAPQAITSCNDELETLVSDSNQTVATYAITTSSRTGSESNMDTSIDRVDKIVADKTTSDDFRLVVVDAVRSLAKQFPQKHDLMLDFFASSSQHPGNVDSKLATVEAISDVSHTDSDAKSSNNASSMLGETIEDSEYPELIVRVLYLLGQIGPQAEEPSQCVRVIYNRIILENSTVRAAAVSALSKFVDVVPGARSLVERSQLDKNDEVRDRAAIALVSSVSTSPSTKLAVGDLETQLLHYLSNQDFEQGFNAKRVRLVSDEARFQERLASESQAVTGEETRPAAGTAAETSRDGTPTTLSGAGAGTSGRSSAGHDQQDVRTQLAEVPELAKLGSLLHSGRRTNSTDEDMEYVVTSRVHVFPAHLVVQYEVRNNYELELSNVNVKFELSEELDEPNLEPDFTVSSPTLAPGHTGSTYVVFSHKQAVTEAYVASTLTFTIAAEDEQDEYPLDDVVIRPGNFIIPKYSSPAEHKQQWDAIDGPGETQLSQFKACPDLVDAANLLEDILDMGNCTGSAPKPTDTTASSSLAGTSVFSDVEVLATVQLVKSSRSGVAGKTTVRCTDKDLEGIVADAAAP